jgi:anti-anti-sigma factor
VSSANATVAVRHAGTRTLVVAVKGEIDLGNAQVVRHAIETAMADADIRAVDLTEVTYIDSQGARLLAELAAAGGARLVVVAPRGSTAGDLLAITGLAEHFVVVETVDDLRE